MSADDTRLFDQAIREHKQVFHPDRSTLLLAVLSITEAVHRLAFAVEANTDAVEHLVQVTAERQGT